MSMFVVCVEMELIKLKVWNIVKDNVVIVVYKMILCWMFVWFFEILGGGVCGVLFGNIRCNVKVMFKVSKIVLIFEIING